MTLGLLYCCTTRAKLSALQRELLALVYYDNCRDLENARKPIVEWCRQNCNGAPCPNTLSTSFVSSPVRGEDQDRIARGRPRPEGRQCPNRECAAAGGAATVLGAGFDLLGDFCADATGSHVYIAVKSGHTRAAVAVCPPPERWR